jgi:AcrR family transcriptional regulator
MGTRERRAREKARRREEILDAARELFWQRGYEATTMPAVAEAAELAPGTLYLYFPGKEALYVALLEEGYEKLLARLKRGVRKDEAPRAQAEKLIDVFQKFAVDHPQYFRIIFFVLQREGRLMRDLCVDEAQWQRLSDHFNACRSVAGGILERAGIARSGAELEHKVSAVWSMLAGVVLYYRQADASNYRAISREAKRTILRGLFGD